MEKQGQELLKEAQKLGVALDGIYDSGGNLREGALQQRVRNAKTVGIARISLFVAILSLIVSAIAIFLSTR